jgi:gas vesicle protein
MKASTFFIGLAAGAAAGAMTALFSTPKSGSELRMTVKNASTDWKEKFVDVKDQVANLKDSISGLTKESKEQIPEVVDGVKVSLQSWKDDTVPIQNRLQDEISAIQQSLDQLEQAMAQVRK